GNIERLTLTRHLAALQVHFNVTKPIELFIFGHRLCTAQNSFDPRQQLANRKGLSHIVVCTQFQTHYFVDFLPACGQHDDGSRGALRLQLLTDVESTHARHHHVENHKIRHIAESTFQSGNAVGSGNDLIALKLEVVA